VCVHKLHLGPIYLPVYLFISSPKRRLIGHIATVSHVRFYDFTPPNPRPRNERNAPLACLLLYPHRWIITSCCSTDSDRPHRCCQQRITLAHAGCCLYFSMGRVMPPPKKKQLPFPLGNPGPMVPWTHPSSHPKRHLD